jgi:hypothetical protein
MVAQALRQDPWNNVVSITDRFAPLRDALAQQVVAAQRAQIINFSVPHTMPLLEQPSAKPKFSFAGWVKNNRLRVSSCVKALIVMAGVGIVASYASVSPINMPVSAPVQVVEMHVPAASVTPISSPFESFNMAAGLYDRAVNSVKVDYERARVTYLAQQVQAAKEAKVFASIKPVAKPVFTKVAATTRKASIVVKPVMKPAPVVVKAPVVEPVSQGSLVAICDFATRICKNAEGGVLLQAETVGPRDYVLLANTSLTPAGEYKRFDNDSVTESYEVFKFANLAAEYVKGHKKSAIVIRHEKETAYPLNRQQRRALESNKYWAMKNA